MPPKDSNLTPDHCPRCDEYRTTIDRAANVLHESFGKGANAVAKAATDARRILRKAVPPQKTVTRDERAYFLERIQEGHVRWVSFLVDGQWFGVYAYNPARFGQVIVADEARTRIWIGFIDPDSEPSQSKIEWLDAPPLPANDGWNFEVHTAALMRGHG